MTIKDYTKNKSQYLQVNPTWHAEDSSWKAAQILKLIKRNNLKPGSIVEIGCGAGEILNQLQQKMDDRSIMFSGYEIAPDAYELCLKRANDKVNYFHEDLLQTNKSYDLLLMIDVFEHVDDYMGFIKQASKRAIHKIYHIPLDMSILSILNNYPLVARKSVGHLHYFMKDTALATIEDSGQEVLDWFYTKSAFEVHATHMNFFGRILNVLRRFFYWMAPNFAVKAFGGFSLIVLTK